MSQGFLESQYTSTLSQYIIVDILIYCRYIIIEYFHNCRKSIGVKNPGRKDKSVEVPAVEE